MAGLLSQQDKAKQILFFHLCISFMYNNQTNFPKVSKLRLGEGFKDPKKLTTYIFLLQKSLEFLYIQLCRYFLTVNYSSDFKFSYFLIKNIFLCLDNLFGSLIHNLINWNNIRFQNLTIFWQIIWMSIFQTVNFSLGNSRSKIDSQDDKV